MKHGTLSMTAKGDRFCLRVKPTQTDHTLSPTKHSAPKLTDPTRTVTSDQPRSYPTRADTSQGATLQSKMRISNRKADTATLTQPDLLTSQKLAKTS